MDVLYVLNNQLVGSGYPTFFIFARRIYYAKENSIVGLYCISSEWSGLGGRYYRNRTTTGEKKNTNVTCPADPGKLSPEELKRLPSECSSVVEQNLMPWLVTGAATALITTLAIVELNDDDDHHRNNSPLPPTPPDDDSDDTPVPPTPGGDEIIPDDGPDDTPTPPKPIAFNNDVILDKTEKTLTIRDSVFSYTENADGTISLQDSNGRKATINLWQIDETNNTVALEGMSADGATKWQYNHNGELVITGDNTTVNNTGKTIVDGKGATGTEIAGNNAVVNQDGELDVSGGGHGIDITGDSATCGQQRRHDRHRSGFHRHSDRRRQGGREQRR